MLLTLNNYTSWESRFIRAEVLRIAEDLKLEGDIRFIFQAKWTDITDEGDIVLDTEQDVGFDGDAYGNGVIRVCVGPQAYPFTYTINEELPGFYLRQVVEIREPYEMFLYMTAHELRHLWQWEHPLQARQIRRLLKCDDETDADIYATMTLSRHRSGIH